MSDSKLFKPLKIGNIEVKHRVAMAPLTRLRASDDHVILPMAVEYYTQRASYPGTLLITEATYISFAHGGNPNSPGIYSAEQIAAWKKVTSAVHSKGSFIYAQLWATGRIPSAAYTAAHNITVKAPSPLPLDADHVVPQEMTLQDIKSTIDTFVQAAHNALEAGFDGVELHGANGYLIDQFLQSNTNIRTDAYGGSVENRSRFAVEVTTAVANAIGPEKVAFRISPWSTFQGMRMDDPMPQFEDLVGKLDGLGLAYLHVVAPRIHGHVESPSSSSSSTSSSTTSSEKQDSFAPLLNRWSGVTLLAGGFSGETAKKLVDEEHANKSIVVVFGRYFISNPDLVYRLERGIELRKYDRSTFYNAKERRGYTDWGFSLEWEVERGVAQA